MSEFTGNDAYQSTYAQSTGWDGVSGLRSQLYTLVPYQDISPYTRELEKLESYLKEQQKYNRISSETMRRAWKALQLLLQFRKRLKLPVVGIGQSEQVLFEWDQDIHHLELEVFPKGEAELFYLNRDTNKACEAYYEIVNYAFLVIDPEMENYLNYFLRTDEL